MSDPRSLLSDEALTEALASLAGWSTYDRSLRKTFKFPDYMSGVRFTNQVAEAAEKLDHHPDILLKWGEVSVSTWTHTVGGVTGMDVKLAEAIEAL